MKRKISLITLLVCVTCTSLWFLNFKKNKTTSLNDQIQNVFQDFYTFAKDNRTVMGDSLCSGGFINQGNADLQKITNNIVSRRVLNDSPLEYATTQDEAGITCLATNDAWVLFSALNNNEFYCIDSTSQKGRMSFSRTTLTCTR